MLTIGLEYSHSGKTMLYAVPVLIRNYVTAAGFSVNRGMFQHWMINDLVLDLLVDFSANPRIV